MRVSETNLLPSWPNKIMAFLFWIPLLLKKKIILGIRYPVFDKRYPLKKKKKKKKKKTYYPTTIVLVVFFNEER